MLKKHCINVQLGNRILGLCLMLIFVLVICIELYLKIIHSIASGFFLCAVFVHICLSCLFLVFYINYKKRRFGKIGMGVDIDSNLQYAFLQNFSHEIRTPVNAIIGFADLLCEETKGQSNSLMYCQIIRKSAFRLLVVNDNLVDYSMVESDSLVKEKVAFCLNAFIETIHYKFQRQVDDSVELLLSNQNSAEEYWIETDEGKLSKIFYHLLDNAIKFTENGVIEFGYHIRKQEIVFFVKDSGIGMSSECQKEIFTPFWQNESGMTRSYEGLGLGLSISHGYVALLGGEISVFSKPNMGSLFSFTIPEKCWKTNSKV